MGRRPVHLRRQPLRARVCLAVCAALGASFLLVGSPVAGSSPTPARYGPHGSQFTVAFLRAPPPLANSATLNKGFPAGTRAVAFWDGSVDVFKSPTLPRPPVYVVIDYTLPSAGDASALLTGLHHLSRLRPHRVGRLSGLEFLGAERLIAASQHVNPTDPTATEGLLVLVSGRTLFEVQAFGTNSRAVAAFMASFNVP